MIHFDDGVYVCETLVKLEEVGGNKGWRYEVTVLDKTGLVYSEMGRRHDLSECDTAANEVCNLFVRIKTEEKTAKI
jgi:hypothetical protein